MFHTLSCHILELKIRIIISFLIEISHNFSPFHFLNLDLSSIFIITRNICFSNDSLPPASFRLVGLTLCCGEECSRGFRGEEGDLQLECCGLCFVSWRSNLHFLDLWICPSTSPRLQQSLRDNLCQIPSKRPSPKWKIYQN